MTPAERIALALGEQFHDLDVAAMVAHPAFRSAVAEALDVMDEDEVVSRVLALGGLDGSRNPHAVVVARIRRLPALDVDRRRMNDDLAEAGRWASLGRAARRGETLRALVEREALFADEAVGIVEREFSDPELAAVALAAMRGER